MQPSQFSGVQSFRVLIVGNTCNYGVWLAILLRRFNANIEVAVLVEDNDLLRDKPEWDSLSDLVDFYDIHIGSFNPSGLNQISTLLSKNRCATLEGYDCIYCFGLMAAMFVCNSGFSFVYHSYGDLLSTPFNDEPFNLRKSLRVFLSRRALFSARAVVISQYADLAVARRFGVTPKLNEVPIMHGEELGNSGKSVLARHAIFDHDGLKFYLPARHEGIKRLDKAINAIADVIEELSLSDVKIVLTSWGAQIKQTEQLIVERKLQSLCVWIPLQTRSELLSNLNSSNTVVLDEFEDESVEMSFGGISRDSISEGAILVTKLNKHVVSGLYQGLPSILDCDHTQSSIKDAVKKAVALTGDQNKLEIYRRDLKMWYELNFNPERLFERYMEIIAP